MRVGVEPVTVQEFSNSVRAYLKEGGRRLGLITSIDGQQVIALLLAPKESTAIIRSAALVDNSYTALAPQLPQAHWFERALTDLFGITPVGHPRLKSIFVEQAFAGFPLRADFECAQKQDRDFHFMHVAGEGVYEIPVGPVHAGIIEPGHFRLSCLGELIQNLELRLGFLHRGVEKRLTEVSWQKARFVAEAAASDTAAANALAHAIAIESMIGVEITPRAQHLRTLALEVERIAMHVGDLGGMAVDLGFLGVAASLSRLRGMALRLADLLSGSRFLRAFICPGGVGADPDKSLKEFPNVAAKLKGELSTVLDVFLDSPAVHERLSGTGAVSTFLAQDFGLVGVAARGSGVSYDTRVSYGQGLFPELSLPVVTAGGGDALARTQVRVGELSTSFSVLENVLSTMPEGPVLVNLPDTLPADAVSAGIVEAFRGELIHLVVTGADGKIKRYTVKDPSFNNWTGMAIAARNNLIADFPVCNKSFGLSYSGHDL